MLWRKPGRETALERREQPGPWRWWEVAVTAYTSKKGAPLRLFPPLTALGEMKGRPPGHGQ